MKWKMTEDESPLWWGDERSLSLSFSGHSTFLTDFSLRKSQVCHQDLLYKLYLKDFCSSILSDLKLQLQGNLSNYGCAQNKEPGISRSLDHSRTCHTAWRLDNRGRSCSPFTAGQGLEKEIRTRTVECYNWVSVK